MNYQLGNIISCNPFLFRTVTGLLILWRIGRIHALDNGLALTPPMGFNTWERYRCTVDCVNFPEGCINEELIMRTADLMCGEFLSAGYEYLVIDDCWLDEKRDSNGDLQENRSRFPRGMQYLSEYVRSKGLKFGIYGNLGERTCAGYPGIMKTISQDADLFANRWSVDFIKLDGCFSDVKAKAVGYPEFGRHLNTSGRPIMYSCSWPSYLIDESIVPNYTTLVETCNLWRNYDDVEDSWASVLDIVEFYAREQETLSRYHGPGHWHDADMLLIGNYGLSYEQSKSQMALWCVMGVPLFISTDLSRIKPQFREILLNPMAIQINQDPLGKLGRRIYNKRGIQVWRRAILPQYQNYFSYAVVVLNKRVDGSPKLVSRTLLQLGLYNPNGYQIEDVYQGKCCKIEHDQSVSAKIPPSGVAFWRLTVLKDSMEPPCFHTNKRAINSVGPYNYGYVLGLIYLAGLATLSIMIWRTRFFRQIHRIYKVQSETTTDRIRSAVPDLSKTRC